jgi:hypothetical protein
MRYYQGLWEKIKKDKVVSLTANRLHHPRIVKAVVKEKWMDHGYKALIDKIPALHHTSKGAILTFHLTLKDLPIRPRDLGILPEQESKCHEPPMKPRSQFLVTYAERLRKL